MTRAQFCLDVGKQRRHIEVKLARDVLGSRRNITKSRVVLVQKLVIEPFAHNFARALFDFADVNQHSCCWIHRAGEDEIGDVIATAPIAAVRFRAEGGQIFAFAPTINMQTPRRGEFQAFADGEEHDSANTLRVVAQLIGSQASCLTRTLGF